MSNPIFIHREGEKPIKVTQDDFIQGFDEGLYSSNSFVCIDGKNWIKASVAYNELRTTSLDHSSATESLQGLDSFQGELLEIFDKTNDKIYSESSAFGKELLKASNIANL